MVEDDLHRSIHIENAEQIPGGLVKSVHLDSLSKPVSYVKTSHSHFTVQYASQSVNWIIS